ncbi:macro domain-containing protein [bacterium]|nr:macro domain-containing protein [bacterium]
MLKVMSGDLFASKAQTLVNTVNCVGVMGKGIALEFKNRYPAMFADYTTRCKRGEVKLGEPYLFKSSPDRWILNFPTKDHWRSLSRIEDIEKGLEFLLTHYKTWGIESIAVPPLGSGLGGLEWRIVGPILNRYLKRLEIDVELYAPHGTPCEEMQLSFLDTGTGVVRPDTYKERINPAWIALVDILKRIEDEPYHWPVGRVMFQKIAYVATLQGIPTGLEFRRGSYGPFAEGLKGLESRLMNHRLIVENRLGQMLAVRVGPSYEVAKEEYAKHLSDWEKTLDNVADLFVRLRTQQAEIVATVLFAGNELAMRTKNTPTEQDVLREVMAWKEHRRPPLQKPEVALTIRNLAMLKRLEVKASADLPLPKEALSGI